MLAKGYLIDYQWKKATDSMMSRLSIEIFVLGYHAKCNRCPGQVLYRCY